MVLLKVSLGVGFEVLKINTKPSSLSLLYACGSDVSSQLLLQCHVCLFAAMLPAMMKWTKPLKLQESTQLNALKVALVIVSLHSNRKLRKV